MEAIHPHKNCRRVRAGKTRRVPENLTGCRPGNGQTKSNRLLNYCSVIAKPFFLAGLFTWVGTSLLTQAIAQDTSARPVEVRINTAQTYQTIEGFGASIIDFTENPAYYENPGFYDRVVDDLGLSMLRLSVPQELEFLNDDADPDHYNWPAFDLYLMDRRMRFAREMKKRGVTRFIASSWSPPPFTKTNRYTRNGGHLRMDQYAEYAEFMSAFIIAAKKNYDIDIGAISIQNEPLFIEPYNSCMYNPEQAREAVRALMRKFSKEGIRTQIQLPEDMTLFERNVANIAPTMADPETRHFPGQFISHRLDTYEGVNQWYEHTQPYGRQNWMTETSGHEQNWAGAMQMAVNMWEYLVGGNFSAWLYWQIAETSRNGAFGLMNEDGPSPKYYAAKHFYRYVRPGALRVDGESTDDDLLVAAFRHDVDGTLATVLINRGTRPARVRVNVNGPALPGKFAVYLSTDSLGCEARPIRSRRNLVLEMPPQSIITLRGESKGMKRLENIAEWPEAWTDPVPGERWGNFNVPESSPGGTISYAAERGVERTVFEEIEKGNLHARNRLGWTALHAAIAGGQLAMVDTLLNMGLDINVPALDGWTPIHMAAATFVGKAGAGDPGVGAEAKVSKYDVFTRVLAARPRLDLTTADGWTPLHAAVINAHTAWGQSEEHNLDRIRDLIAAGVPMDARDADGRTALHWAAWQGYSRFTHTLLASSAVTDVLLKTGAAVDIPDTHGRTPLHYAAEMGYGDIVLSLIQFGADPARTDADGKTPLDLARQRELTGIIAILENTAVPRPPEPPTVPESTSAGKLGPELLKASRKGDITQVKELLKKDADVFYRDSDGFRAIDRARDNGHREIVKLLKAAEEKK